MNKDQEKKTRNNITGNGYSQSSYNADIYYNGKSRIRLTGNGIIEDGNRRDTYSTTKNYLDKKKG